jgi:hypothetical protein
MTTRRQFIDWLLPDARAAAQANPSPAEQAIARALSGEKRHQPLPTSERWDELDPEVQALFDDVMCQTGVPVPWLADAAGLVVDGLAGLQCLWFLHGLSGEVVVEEKRLPFTLNRELDGLISETGWRADDKYRKRHPEGGIAYVGDWVAGTVTEMQWEASRLHDGPPDKERVMKLGRWLRKQGASKELLHAFETRELPVWHWRISANPLDVLTMSFRRPWTSCMRPPDYGPDEPFKEAGEAQYGPLTDMASGSAVLFWYRPGASQPCGRIVLRPALVAESYDPTVLWPGNRQYGCGPALNVGQFNNIIGPLVEPLSMEISDEPLCRAGLGGRALSRLVYSDVDNDFCRQREDEYLEAYELLGTAAWPQPEYTGPEMRSVALEWQGELDSDVDATMTFDVPRLVQQTMEFLDATIDVEKLAQVYFERDLGELGTLVYNALDDINQAAAENDDIWADVKEGVWYALALHLTELAEAASTDVFAIPVGKELAREVRELQNVAGGKLIWPADFIHEEGGGSLLVPLKLYQDSGGPWLHKPDGRMVSMLLVVSQAFAPAYGELPARAVSKAVVPPGAWPWYFSER